MKSPFKHGTTCRGSTSGSLAALDEVKVEEWIWDETRRKWLSIECQRGREIKREVEATKCS